MIFPWTVWGLRDQYGHSRQASTTTFPHVSLFTKDDDRARWPLHSVVSHRNILRIFVPLPPAVLIGFTHEVNIALEAGLAKFCFSVLCSSCFSHSNKATDF